MNRRSVLAMSLLPAAVATPIHAPKKRRQHTPFVRREQTDRGVMVVRSGYDDDGSWFEVHFTGPNAEEAADMLFTTWTLELECQGDAELESE